MDDENWVQKLKRKVKEYFTGLRNQAPERLKKLGYSDKEVNHFQNVTRSFAEKRRLMGEMTREPNSPDVKKIPKKRKG